MITLTGLNVASDSREIYWHVGINRTLNHADEIGVFNVGQTVGSLGVKSDTEKTR